MACPEIKNNKQEKMLSKLDKHSHSNIDKMTPIPKAIVSITFFLVFFQGMVMTTVFSYLPKMVKSFGTTEVDTGYYAGFIASILFIGMTIFCFVWGYLADRFGNRKTSIACATFLSLSTLAFGFSYCMYWAVITRFLQGSSMGMLLIGKSLVGRNCDESNVSIAMSIIMSSYSIGLSLGPSLAGFLVFPADQYPEVFSKDGLFGRFRILLPNLLLVVGMLLLTIFVVIFLPEDEIKVSGYEYELIDSKNLNNKSNECLENTNSGDHTISHVKQLTNKKELTVNRCISREPNPKKNYSKLYQVIRNKWLIICCAQYGLLDVAGVGADEMFPLYASTSRCYGGVGFSPADIGLALLVGATFLTVLQLTLVTMILRKYGAKNTFISGALMFVLLTPSLPTVARIENRNVLWVALLIYIVATRTAYYAANIAIHILLNNSVEPFLLGCANGVAISVTSLGRSIAPFMFGSIYTWSLTNVKKAEVKEAALGFPFNQYFAFFILSLTMLCSAIIAFNLPASLNHPPDKS